jgi:hypothetical protein
MEDNTNLETTQTTVETKEQVTTTQTPDIGFPMSSQKPKGKSNKLVFIILGLVILIGAIIFLIGRGKKEETVEVSPTPAFEEVTPISSATPAATPTATDKAKVVIEIQNGTGIAGEAGYLQGVLKTLGYSKITVGNATAQNATATVVTFSSTLGGAIVNEITAKLQAVYQSVQVKTATEPANDVEIVTGLRVGATAKPSATPTASPTAKPSASPTATPTAPSTE